MLQVLDQIPSGLLECPATGLQALLGGPTLLHLPGTRPEPLHVSVLLHGNEIAGWEAVRGILRDFAQASLPRALSIFIGNVSAARVGARRLPEQPDYNRIWDGGDLPEHRMMQQVIEEVARRSPFASVDVHNTTGPNPHYACVHHLDPRSLYLARRFSRPVVFLQNLGGLHSMALSKICPAVTVECGMPEQAEGVAHARAYLTQRLFDEVLPDRAPTMDEMELFRAKARVRIPGGMSFSFRDKEAECVIRPELVEQNFRQLAQGTRFGAWCREASRLNVDGEDGPDLFDVYFENQGQQLLVRQPFFLSMLTLHEEIVAQDCLCYLMERMDPKTLDQAYA